MRTTNSCELASLQPERNKASINQPGRGLSSVVMMHLLEKRAHSGLSATCRPLDTCRLSFHLCFTPRLTSHSTPDSLALQAFKGRTAAARTLPKQKPAAKPKPLVKAKSKPAAAKPSKPPSSSSSSTLPGEIELPLGTDASLGRSAVEESTAGDTEAPLSTSSSGSSNSPSQTLPGAQLQVSETVPGAEDPFNEEDEEVFPQIVLDLPLPSHSRVRTAAYVKSSVKHTQCPAPNMAEFAVIGRSNVGKSSLINLLTSSKNLALVSKEPGKTKCINHFIINNQWYLVDLPGYGYARLGREQRNTFEDFTREYFTERKNLAMVFLLIDGSIPPQRVDLDYVNWLTDTKVPFSIVFTKVDKRKKKCPGQIENVTEFKREVLKSLDFLPPTLLTSSMDGRGRVAVLGFMSSLRLSFERSGKLVKNIGRRGKPPLRSETGGPAHDDDDDEDNAEEDGRTGGSLPGQEVGAEDAGVGKMQDLGGSQVMIFKRPLVEPENTAELVVGLLKEIGVDASAPVAV